jgi:membrane protein YqaA with SNARE-associated domain
MWYLVIFFSALILDFIPVVGPPSWVIMVWLLVKFHLNPWIVIPLGAFGSTIGKYLMTLCVPRFSKVFIKRTKHEELQYVGKKLTRKLWHSWLFVFLFAISPLPDVVLFTAAAIAKLKPFRILPPYFCGKLITLTVLLFVGRYTVASFANHAPGTFPWKGIVTIIFGIVLFVGLLFIDGRALLQKKKFTFNFKIWK